MQTKLFLISAACILGTPACAHVQSAEMDPPPAESTTSPTPAPQAAADTARAQDSSASSAQVSTPAQLSPSAAPYLAEQPGDELSKKDPPSMATASAAEPMPQVDDHAATEGEPLARFVLTRAIEDREPVDEGVSFKPGERVYAFLEVANPNGSEYALNLRWAAEEEDLGEPTALTIGTSPRWRTWSWLRAPEKAGSYRCFIETEDGQQMAEIPFRVES